MKSERKLEELTEDTVGSVTLSVAKQKNSNKISFPLPLG
jgi:hypothetical protein